MRSASNSSNRDQYHVPGAFVSSSASATPPNALDANGCPSASSAAPPPSLSNGGRQDGASTGVAVGQGLLSGRRLAVRIAPPGAVAAPPLAQRSHAPPYTTLTPASAATSYAGTVNTVPSNFAAHLLPSGSFSSQPPPSLPPTAAPPQPPQVSSSTSYGGGIIRISDLRRQGVQSVESGLRLPTLQGGRPAAALVTSTTTDTQTPLADVFAPSPAGSAATRRGRRTAGNAASTKASGGHNGGRRRGTRGSTGSRRSSRGSLEVTLTETGELCDYRWFTARGRRGFIYDGRTYKGSAAHRMWAKVKEVASRRGRSVPQQRPAQPQHQALTSTTAARAARTTTSAAAAPPAAPAARTAQHRTSARAVAAAGRSLHLENASSFFSCVPGHPVQSGGASAASPPLQDEWRDLMRELGVEGEEEVIAFAAHAQPAHPVDPARPPVTIKASQHSPGVSAADDVVEITDSSDDEAASSSSDTDASSSSEESAGASVTAQLSPPPPSQHGLQWPTTSYFSDESCGWSTDSSQGSASQTHEKVKREATASQQQQQQLHTANSAPLSGVRPRVRVLNGVEVVEEDGWIYPADVYASQQQERRKNAAAPETASAAPPSPPPRLSTESTLSAFGLAALQDVNDVPLAQLFPVGVVPPTTAALRGRGKREREDLLLRGALPFPAPTSSHGSAGIAVVRGGKDGTVPLRPATSTSRNTTDVAAAVLRGVNDSDLLEGFAETELADLFVTGEEVGGVRYGV